MKNKSKTSKQPKLSLDEISYPTPSNKATILSSFKYLRRALHTNPYNQRLLIKLNIKRFHVRKFTQKDKDNEFDSPSSPREMYKKRFKTNLFKALTDLHFSPFYGFNWLEDLKNCKKLINYQCKPESNYELALLIKYLKRINKNIEKIDFFTQDYIIKNPLKNHYKAIRKFPKLKVLHMNPRLKQNHELMVKQYFQSRNRYLSRMTSLRDLDWNLPRSGNVPIQQIIKKEAVYSKITQLAMPLYDICDVFEPQQSLIQYNSDMKIEAFLESVNLFFENQSANKMFERFSQEFPPSFPFQIFPHFKQLGLEMVSTEFIYHPVLFSFIAKGFRGLCSLEKLHLNLDSHAPQLEEIFKGMLDLPQLSSFSLIVDSLMPLDWNLLTEFLKKQQNLVSLRFDISNLTGQGSLKKESESLEDLLASLSQKPKLQYLRLKLNSWSLSDLSRGLKGLVDTHQIKSFRFQVNRSGFCSIASVQHLLCEFLLRNKGTLYELILDFILLHEQKSNEEISKAISQLTQLKNLSLKFSVISILNGQVSLIPRVASDEAFQDSKEQRNPRLDILLKPLTNLQNLTLDFSEIGMLSLPNQKWRSGSFKILPVLKSLRRFKFMIPDELSQDEVKTINSALENLDQLHHLDFEYVPGWDDGFIMDGDYYSDWEESHPFGKVVEKVKAIRAQQDLRINLSF